MSDPATTVRDLAQPLAATAGLDLVDVEVKGSGPRTLVRVKVDRKGGVELAECQALSRELSRALDDADPIDSRYQLEVTSPGVNHPLQTQRDFDRVQGRVVTVHRAQGAGEVKGTVADAGDTAVVLDVDGERVTVAYDEIDKATQALPW
ncbi:MAG TPA: ribosome maturation factor RimP [Egibacteraceae bacterium]|nr:ribosome maturation factor RimP [Egibacteraceae bacterium]